MAKQYQGKFKSLKQAPHTKADDHGSDTPKTKTLKSKTAIIVTNLGTPDEATVPALRRYLAEFLGDARVVEIPRLIWLTILYGIILVTRPKKSAALYKSIWTDQGSPLLAISRRQQQALQDKLQQEYGDDVVVELAMRYGNPSVSSALEKLQQQGIHRIVVLPLYPQNSGTTTGSTFDAVANELKQWRWVPELHFVAGYTNHPKFSEALANSIKQHFGERDYPSKIMFSYHGMPKRNLELGDPYYCYCKKTTRLVREHLGLDEKQCITTFQSLFGKAEWLRPYTSETLEQLPKEGVKDIAVICPAFSADCLETLEEIEEENKEVFLEAGGESYEYIPCLNDSEEHLELMTELVKPYLELPFSAG